MQALATKFGFWRFWLGNDPASASFSVRDLALPKGINGVQQRKSMLETVDAHFRKLKNPMLLVLWTRSIKEPMD